MQIKGMQVPRMVRWCGVSLTGRYRTERAFDGDRFVCFQYGAEAICFQNVLPKRLGKFARYVLWEPGAGGHSRPPGPRVSEQSPADTQPPFKA